MLHAMLWNEIHALQSVPPPLPARAAFCLRLCSNKEHARRRTETKRMKCRRKGFQRKKLAVGLVLELWDL